MHFYSTLVRGLGKAKPSRDFNEVLHNLWWRLDRVLNIDDVYISAIIPLIQAIRAGTTTLIDHHASPGAIAGSLAAIARAVEETGVRASLCYEVSDRDGEAVAREGLEENAAFIKSCQKENGTLLRALFGLHASFTVGDKTLDKAVELANGLGAGFHVHTAEAESDQYATVQKHGMRVVERWKKHGVLGKNTILAHCVHVSDHEMDLIAESGSAVVHNPQSNLNNAVGTADVLSLLKKRVLVGLGTDAMTVNMIEELRCGLWAQKCRQANAGAAFMELTGALLDGNAAIANRYWKGLGELKPGAAADVVLVDYLAPTPLDSSTFLGHLVFGLRDAPVDTTIVAGRVLMSGKKLEIGIDEERIAARSRELAQALWKRF
jgi:putative selenium metabolism protein SsnA